jgi:hypothetical protein
VAVNKLILFGGRLILAHNEMLYPPSQMVSECPGKSADKPVDFNSLYS